MNDIVSDSEFQTSNITRIQQRLQCLLNKLFKSMLGSIYWLSISEHVVSIMEDRQFLRLHWCGGKLISNH